LQNQRTGGWNRSYLGRQYQWEGGRGGGMVKKGEYGANNHVHMSINGKKRYLLKLFQEWGQRGIKENGGEMNSSMIQLTHCKNLCKCHSVPPPSNNNFFLLIYH
jgi:hypothetical protein